MELRIRPVGRVTPLVAMIRQMGKFDLVNGPWVGGGAARTVFEEMPLGPKSDIDIFFTSVYAGMEFEYNLKAQRIHSSIDHNKAGTAIYKAKFDNLIYDQEDVTIQIIHGMYFKTVTELFQSFDFTICQFATDGHHIIYTANAERDLKSRMLMVEPEYKKLVSRPSRLIKYMNYGFDPGPGVLSWTMNIDNRDIQPGLWIADAY